MEYVEVDYVLWTIDIQSVTQTYTSQKWLFKVTADVPRIPETMVFNKALIIKDNYDKHL